MIRQSHIPDSPGYMEKVRTCIATYPLVGLVRRCVWVSHRLESFAAWRRAPQLHVAWWVWGGPRPAHHASTRAHAHQPRGATQADQHTHLHVHVHHRPKQFYFTPGDTGFKAWKTRYATIGVAICWDQVIGAIVVLSLVFLLLLFVLSRLARSRGRCCLVAHAV